MFGKKDEASDGQISETSMMTPEGGVDGTPGTEDGTPAAADAQHAPHEGPKDYAGSGQHLSVDEQNAPGDGHDHHDHHPQGHVQHDDHTGEQTLLATTDGDGDGDTRRIHDDARTEGVRTEGVREGETFRPDTH